MAGRRIEIGENTKWMLLLAVVIALFFWKILFTAQYSLIIGWETTNQAYAWYDYAVRAIKHGVFPAWNPYLLGGTTYLGEPQTSLFYPLKALMYLWPLEKTGALSARIFHDSFVLAHFLAACFMFLLVKELGVQNNFAAFISACCFSLGGFLGRLSWVNLADSAVWLPLILLFLLRAFHSATVARRMLNACFSGLAMAMAILAGSLHIPLMDVLVVVSASVFFALQPSGITAPPWSLRSRLVWCAIFISVVGVVSFCVASLQLLSSMEYAPLARRWTGEWSGLFGTRIPYLVTTGGNGIASSLGPRSLFAFVFGAAPLGGGEFSTYFGVMPLLLTIIGVWQNWEKPWVRYLTGLGIAAFFYAMGSYSFLHGIIYILIPLVDKAWESGRFLYLTHFAMAVLAGFGVQTLFSGDARSNEFLSRLKWPLQWLVILMVLALGIPTLLGKPDVVEWSYASLLFVLASWSIFLYIIRGNRTNLARFLLLAVIVCDLDAFNFTFLNKMAVEKEGHDYLAQMMSVREAADFVKSQGGLYRVDIDGESMPTNMGDVWDVQTITGWGATMLDNYLPIRFSPLSSCLLNTRYMIRRASDPHPNPVFTGRQWKVYENPSYCSRAWVVRDVVSEPSNGKIIHLVQDGKFDPLHRAYVTERLQSFQEPEAADAAQIAYTHYDPNSFELNVNTPNSGLLVLSEIYYPGWQATVNGKAAHIYKVDGLLRGVVVSPGQNHIIMRYRPRLVPIGAVLTACALLGIIVFAVILKRKEPKKG